MSAFTASYVQLRPPKLKLQAARTRYQQRLRPCCQSVAGDDFSSKAQGFASDAQQKAANFFEKQRVQEKAQTVSRQATRKFKEAYEVLGDSVKRTAADVDKNFDVSGKAQRAAQQVKEQAETIDTEYGVRRRLRNFFDDVGRKLPQWQKRYRDFSKTRLGTFATTLFIFYLFYTGIAFRIINFIFLLWWILPVLVIPWLEYKARKAAAQAQEQARQQQPFGGGAFGSNPFIENLRAQYARANMRPGAGAAGGREPPRKQYDQQPGPVIDAEWETIDDGDK